MNAWLGDGDNGNRWRKFLQIDQLQSELAKGTEADPVLATRALQRLKQRTPGLELAPFAAVRTSLAAWVTELKQRYQHDLAGLARASRGDYVPIVPEDFEQVHADMRNKVRALEHALGGSEQAVAAWKNYLGWDLLEPHLGADPKIDRKSLADLDEVIRRFHTNQQGLELPPFTAAVKAIARYRAQVTWATASKTRDSRPDYERLVTSMAEQLSRHVVRPTTETGWKVGRVLGVIDSLEQSPELVRAIRRSLDQPNVRGSASANFLTRTPNRSFDRISPVRDCILGTSIFGTAHTLGSVRYELLPSETSVELAVYLQGVANSRSRGYHDPVRIRSTSRTDYWAHKRLTLNNDIFTSAGAQASVTTRSNIHSIRKKGGNFGRRLVEKVAWKRAMEQKHEAERIASEHARQRILREFDDTVARDLAAARVRYNAKLRDPMVRRGISPEYLRISSSPSGVFAETLLAGRGQLGASGPAPPMAAVHDLWVQIHESAVNNYLPLALASARISQQTADKAPDLTGNVPNWLKAIAIRRPDLAAQAQQGAKIIEQAQEQFNELVPENEKPAAKPPAFKAYSITLNSEAPVSMRFDDGQIGVRVRASALAAEDVEYDNWDFIVTYEIRQKDNHIVLKRVGNIEVFPTGFDPAWDKQLTAQQSAFRNTLAGNMNARAKAGQSFPAEIPIEPVRLSQYGILVLKELVADDGWLSVGWVLPPPGSIDAMPMLEGGRADGVIIQPAS